MQAFSGKPRATTGGAGRRVLPTSISNSLHHTRNGKLRATIACKEQSQTSKHNTSGRLRATTRAKSSRQQVADRNIQDEEGKLRAAELTLDIF